MKKVLGIILFLLCACASYAVSYAKPYRGSYSSGSCYTTSSAYRSSGFASAPVATMGSTSSYKAVAPSMSGNISVQPVRGIYTSASKVRGGVTAGKTYGRMNAPRKTPGVPTTHSEEDLPHCGCYWYYDFEAGVWKCTNCGCEIEDEDVGAYDSCCELEDTDCYGHCDCPIGDGWQVWLFMAILAAGYGCFVIRRREKVVKSEE